METNSRRVLEVNGYQIYSSREDQKWINSMSTINRLYLGESEYPKQE